MDVSRPLTAFASGAVALIASTASAPANPITFAAPPAMSRGQIGFTGQGVLVRAPSGPPPENANETVLAGSLTAMAGVLPRTTVAVMAGYIDKSSEVEIPNGGAGLRVRTATARRIRPTDRFVRDVEAVCGAGSVRMRA